MASAILRLESDLAFVGHPPETCSLRQNPPATVQALNGIKQVSVCRLIWACLGNAESVFSPVVATPLFEVCSVLLNCFIGPLKQPGRYYVHCVITLVWGVSLVFRMCNLPGHEVSLYCVFFHLHL